MENIANYVDGQLEAPASGRYLDNFEPATGRVYSRVPSSDGSDLDAAVTAAEKAFPDWSRTPSEERSRLLLALAELVDANAEELAQAESKDNGKPVSLARALD